MKMIKYHVSYHYSKAHYYSDEEIYENSIYLPAGFMMNKGDSVFLEEFERDIVAIYEDLVNATWVVFKKKICQYLDGDREDEFIIEIDLIIDNQL